jgi:hypothetical protein
VKRWNSSSRKRGWYSMERLKAARGRLYIIYSSLISRSTSNMAAEG